MTEQEKREYWEKKKAVATKKVEVARSKATLKKWLREVQVCDMYLREL